MNQIVDWLVYFFVFSVPLERISTVPGIGTPTRAAGMLMFIAWLANLFVCKRIRWPHLFHIAACLFFIWNISSLLWTQSYSDTVARANTYFQLGILIFILWDRIKTHASICAVMQAYILGVYYCISIIYSNFLTGSYGKGVRFTAGEFDDNDLAIFISLAIPMAWYLITSGNLTRFTKKFKIINFIFVPVAISGILLTASRTAMISLFPSFIYIVSAIRSFTFLQQALFIGFGLMCALAIPFFIPADTFMRLSTVGDSISSGDINGRSAIWQEGLRNYLQNPLLGVGSGAFHTTVESGKVAHNAIFDSLFEVGFIGLLLFVVAGLIAFVYSAKSSSLWLAIFSILLLGAMTLSWAHRKPTWVIMSLGVIHSQIYYDCNSGNRKRMSSFKNTGYLLDNDIGAERNC